MKKLALIAASIATAAFGFSASAHAQCGEVTVGEANWSTAQILAQIDAFVLENGYGCSVTVTPTSTTTTLALAQGSASPLVVSEFWANGVDPEVLAAAQENGEIAVTGVPFPEAGEFWYVSPAFAESHPELDTVEKVLARPDLFPSPTVDGAGAFYGCPIGIGWGCEHSNTNMFKGFDMEAMGWNLENPASFEGMNSIIVDANLASGNWFGYYWTPTAVAIENGLVPLSFEADFVGNEAWGECYSNPEPAATCDHIPTAYTPSTVVTATTPSLEDLGEPYDYVLARELPMAVLGGLDAYMSANQATAADTAVEFLKNNTELWGAWVSDEAADAIAAAL